MASGSASVPRRRTKQQVVYEALRERILSGAYTPGFRLVIDALAAEFAMSALPVREAIRRLEAEGLAVHRPNAGAVVTPADPAAYVDELGVLALLEGSATALAAPRLTGEDLRRLRASTAAMGQAMNDMDSLAFGRDNRAFHAVFFERCPNRPLVELAAQVERRLDAIRRTVFVHIPYRGAASIEEHDELIDLVESGADPAGIEAAARRHKLRTVESFQRWRDDRGGG